MVKSGTHYKEQGDWNNLAENKDLGGGAAYKGGFDQVRYLEERDIKPVSLQRSGKPMCTHTNLHTANG
jgi:hypothetical protein